MEIHSIFHHRNWREKKSWCGY